MGTEKVRKALKNIGLTEKEAELYIYLAKHYALRSGEIAKGIQTHRVEIYRMLKSMQTKGLIEVTLESPRRFIAVPLEMVLDSFIKTKRQETILMEKTKQSVLNEWKNIRKTESRIAIEKFAIVEGNKKIYTKFLNMVKEAKNQISAVTTATDLRRAEQFGVLDVAFNHPLKEKIKINFLTDLSDANLNMIKNFSEKTSGIDFKGRNPALGLQLSPRMVIRDKKELLFFIRPTTETSIPGQTDVCLWTDCEALVHSFSVMFEDLWLNSDSFKTDKTPIVKKHYNRMEIFDEAKNFYTKYRYALQTATKEIVLVAASETSQEINEIKRILDDSVQKDVKVKIMLPVTNDNTELVQEFLKKYEVRHVPLGYLAMTLIDDNHLFQLKTPNINNVVSFESAFYTSDCENVTQAKKMLNEIWEKAQKPSATTLKSILQTRIFNLPNMMGAPFLTEEKPRGYLNEKDILQKIVNSRGCDNKSCNAIDRRYGTLGLAVIHPPSYLKLPEIMIIVNKIEKQSTLGEEDAIVFLSWLETPKGYAYSPVAIIGDNPKAHTFWKTMNSGNPAAKNTHLLNKDEIEIRIHGNTLFANWSVPIPLYPKQLTLPPACILIEGFGAVKTTAYTVVPPSGYRIEREENYLDAFVTFFHPSTKYSGPGTDGCLIRDSIISIYPPVTEIKPN
jgi:sugar-specific transcriptional regulator TrmB